MEVWGGEPGLAAELGEAAFQVTLEVDAGGGLVPLTDLGTASTGRTLHAPDTILMDGNAPANRVHFDSGVIDAPVAVGTTLAVALTIPPEGDIGTGFIYGVDNVRVRSPSPGDANGDGVFTRPTSCKSFRRASTRMKLTATPLGSKAIGTETATSTRQTLSPRFRPDVMNSHRNEMRERSPTRWIGFLPRMREPLNGGRTWRELRRNRIDPKPTVVRNAAGPQPNGVLPHPDQGRFRWSLDFLPRERRFQR